MNRNLVSKIIRFALPAVALLMTSAFATTAQTPGAPQVMNAQMETRAVSGTLENTMRAITSAQAAAAWVGYSVPMINPGDGRRIMMCCGNWNSDYGVQNCGPCVLESSRGVNTNETDRPVTNSGPVKLEGPTTMYVLLRIADHKIGRVATYTEDCQIDAGGLHFTWLTGVKSRGKRRAAHNNCCRTQIIPRVKDKDAIPAMAPFAQSLCTAILPLTARSIHLSRWISPKPLRSKDRILVGHCARPLRF